MIGESSFSYATVVKASKHSLTFKEFNRANVERCRESIRAITDWSPAEWAVGMAGEAGEACNLIRKLTEIEPIPELASDDHVDTVADLKDAIALELADTLMFLDILAERLGINLEEALIKKFNIVSQRKNSEYYL